jgi:hypothetical protein
MLDPFKVAEAENARARQNWDAPIDGKLCAKKNIKDLIQPYLGSGLSQTEVARRLGCSGPAVSGVLKRTGWTL